MGDQTTKYEFPFPDRDDPADPPAHIQALAQRVETVLTSELDPIAQDITTLKSADAGTSASIGNIERSLPNFFVKGDGIVPGRIRMGTVAVPNGPAPHKSLEFTVVHKCGKTPSVVLATVNHASGLGGTYVSVSQATSTQFNLIVHNTGDDNQEYFSIHWVAFY